MARENIQSDIYMYVTDTVANTNTVANTDPVAVANTDPDPGANLIAVADNGDTRQNRPNIEQLLAE